MRIESDAEWAAGRVGGLPARWQRRLLRQWQRMGGGNVTDPLRLRDANIFLREITESLRGVHVVQLDASDDEVRAAADKQAARCLRMAHRAGSNGRREVADYVRRCGVEPPDKDMPDGPALARMQCPLWWRRKLRRLLAVRVEGAAIRLGLVNRRWDCYVSDESLRRVQAQKCRNAQMMEATRLENENGQIYTIAELAAKSPANAEIRRAELMVRITGFERIARDMGHVGFFVTVTCPSKMHKFKTVNNQVVENQKYDGTTPRQAQDYLCALWKNASRAIKHKKISPYGMRIVEPHHDGAPHWHMLFFCEKAHSKTITEIMRKYALKIDGSEPGAALHRCKIEYIDWDKGSAASYIAKYVSKNIDGYRVGTDLEGAPALESSQRVQAWAKTWGIRQFQQVGGPPVTVWRELRRVKTLPETAPDFLRMAHEAVNKTAVYEGRENACVAWDRYVRAQGGPACGRNYRIRLSTVEQEGQNRYGEPKPPRPWGVEAVEREHYIPHWMAHLWERQPNMPRPVRLVTWAVESERHTWRFVRGGHEAPAHEKGVYGPLPAAPWTRVNNYAPDGVREQIDDGIGAFGAHHAGLWGSPPSRKSTFGRGVFAAH